VTTSGCVIVGPFSSLFLDLHVRGCVCILMWLCLCTVEASGKKKLFIFSAARWSRLGSDGYGHGDERKPDGSENPRDKWLLTGCSLTSRNKSSVTCCLCFSGNTQQCMFRMTTRCANDVTLMIRGVHEKFTRHRK